MALPGRYDLQCLRDHNFYVNVTAADAIRHGFTSFFQCGTFDTFPDLKLVLPEVGSGWISYWLDRMDALYDSMVGRSLPLKEKPSYYFKRDTVRGQIHPDRLANHIGLIHHSEPWRRAQEPGIINNCSWSTGSAPA